MFQASGALVPSLLVLLTAILWDVIWGEPPNALHPVAWMGRVISFSERYAMRGGPRLELWSGAVVSLAIPSLFAAAAALLVRALEPGWFEFFVSSALLKSTFAYRALGQAADRVGSDLRSAQIDSARTALGSLCSRNASELDAPRVVAATVESLAENTSDSCIAPLFYYCLFGISGAVFYRAVNTLDAMIGYHGRYEFFGKAAARLDDLLNLIPARLTAGLLLIAGATLGYDVKCGWATLRRDGAITESPNAGRPMAAMAGLLRVELEKPGAYRLGTPIEPLTPWKIRQAWTIVTVAVGLAATFAAVWMGASHAWSD